MDEDTAVIGAHLNGDKGNNSGSAYVFSLGLVTVVDIDIKPGSFPNIINLGVDLHRNLTQKRPFIASKTDPPAAAWIFEKLAVPFA